MVQIARTEATVLIIHRSAPAVTPATAPRMRAEIIVPTTRHNADRADLAAIVRRIQTGAAAPTILRSGVPAEFTTARRPTTWVARAEIAATHSQTTGTAGMRSLTTADAVPSLRSATAALRSRVRPHPAAAMVVAAEAGQAGAAAELLGVRVEEAVRAAEAAAGVPTVAARRMDATKRPI